MTDEMFVYREDQKDRASTAKGAYHRGNTGKKSCRLAQDYMSRKELAAMNGEVKTVILGELITLEDFHKLSDDLALKWVNSIITKYGVSARNISAFLFELNPGYIYNRMYAHGRLDKYINKVDRPKQKDIRAFKAAITEFFNEKVFSEDTTGDYISERLTGENTEPDDVELEDIPEIPEGPEVEEDSTDDGTACAVISFDLSFEKFDDNIIRVIKMVCGDRPCSGSISITFPVDDEEA